MMLQKNHNDKKDLLFFLQLFHYSMQMKKGYICFFAIKILVANSLRFENKHYYAGSVCSLVFDEADSLFDDSFLSVTNKLLSKLCRVNPVLTEAMSIAGENTVQNNNEAPLAETQVLFVGATMPKILPSSPVGSLVNTDQLKILRTGQLHRVLPHVKQKFIRAPKVKREEYLLRVVEKDIKAGNPVIIFSNKASTSNFIAHEFTCRFTNVS